jgi:hypothetical protein
VLPGRLPYAAEAIQPQTSRERCIGQAAYIEANTLIVREKLQKASVGLAHLLDAASGK